MLTLVRANLQSRIGFLIAWIVPLNVLLAVVPAAYRDTYPTDQDLEILAATMRPNLSTRVLYGIAPDPFTIPGFTMWEMGTWILVLGSVMSLLLAVQFSRAAEENGLLELVRATGIRRQTPLLAAACTTSISSCILGLVCAVVLYAQSPLDAGFDLYSCLIAGKVIALTTAFFGAIGMLAAQATMTARAARIVSLSALGVLFCVRSFADIWEIDWLRWITPFGLPHLVQPFDQNRILPLVVTLAVTLTCFIVAMSPYRDLHGYWLRNPLPNREPRRTALGRITLRIQNNLGASVVWGVTICIVTVAFYSVTGEMDDLIERSPNTNMLLQKLTESTNTETSYLEFISTPIGILFGCAAIQCALRASRDEATGTLTQEVTNGNHKIYPLLIDFCIAIASTVLTLAITAPLAAAAAEWSSDSAIFRTAVYSLTDHLPGMITLAGFAALATGIRRAWLAWLPLAGSGVITFFGNLLDFPEWLLNASVFAWPAHEHMSAAGALVAIGFAALLLGAVAYRRRDLHC